MNDLINYSILKNEC